MPGSEKRNTTSDTGIKKRKQRRNSNAHMIHFAVDHLKHNPFLLSHILTNCNTAALTCQSVLLFYFPHRKDFICPSSIILSVTVLPKPEIPVFLQKLLKTSKKAL